MAAALQSAGIDGTLAQAITAAASTAVGAAVGGTAGAAAAGNEVVNNYLKHPQILAKEAALANCSAAANPSQCRSDVQAKYNQLSRDNTSRLENCSDTKSCRSAVAEVAADYITMSARCDQLQALDYQGKATVQERQELMDLNLNIDSVFGGGATVSATAEQVWRQLRATTSYSAMTDTEKSKTFADAMMALGGLGAGMAAGGIAKVTGKNAESIGANGGVATAGGTANTVNGARLNMQLTAEQAAGTRAPTTITSYSDHAVTQIGSRDGGIGVSQAAVNDAFANPVSIQYVPSKYGPTFKYTGQNATVVVNSEGNVVTTWATNSAGTGK